MKCPHCQKEMTCVYEYNLGNQTLSLDSQGHVTEWGKNEITEAESLVCGECFEEIGWIENDQVVLF